MTKRCFCLSASLALVCAVFGMQPSSSQSSSKSMGLSGGFSAAATELTRTVDSYSGVTDVGISEISDALAVASKQAHSAGELQSMKVLRTFLEDKMDNNQLRESAVAKAVEAWKSKHPTGDAGEAETVRADARELPGMREMTHREDDCAAEMMMIFRSGTFHEPQRCGGVRLSKDAHAMAQYFPQNVVSIDTKIKP